MKKKMMRCLLMAALQLTLLGGMSAYAEAVTEEGALAPEEAVTEAMSEGESAEQSVFAAAVLQDLDLNETELKDLLAENEVTMLNIWATFCGPCLREMPGIQSLHEKYAEEGFGVIGLTGDILDYNGELLQDVLEDAKTIQEEMGLTYPLLIADWPLMNEIELYAFPTTYFLDSDGAILGEAYVGSREESDWEEIITGLLEQ